jgi:hypothetical protein
MALLLLSVVPVCVVSALLSLPVRPVPLAGAHLCVLALFGCILAELRLVNFYKIPFTCSYLPGKSNVQLVFWGVMVVFLVAASAFAALEQRALGDLAHLASLLCSLILVETGLWTFNRQRAKSAVLYFEELPEQVITTLGLRMAPHAAAPKSVAPPHVV